MLASKNGRIDVVRALLSEGACVGTQGKDCVTAMQLAAYNGHEEVLEVLMNAATPDDLTVSDPSGNSMLHFSVYKGNSGSAMKILAIQEPEQAAALVNQPNSVGYTPFMLAVRHGFEPLMQKLITAKADLEARTRNLVPILTPPFSSP